MSISGDMLVKEQTIDFALKGTVSSEMIEVRGNEIYLKIDKDVDDGVFMRLGPSKVSDYDPSHLDMEVAYYRTEEDALKPRTSTQTMPAVGASTPERSLNRSDQKRLGNRSGFPRFVKPPPGGCAF